MYADCVVSTVVGQCFPHDLVTCFILSLIHKNFECVVCAEETLVG